MDPEFKRRVAQNASVASGRQLVGQVLELRVVSTYRDEPLHHGERCHAVVEIERPVNLAGEAWFAYRCDLPNARPDLLVTGGRGCVIPTRTALSSVWGCCERLLWLEESDIVRCPGSEVLR